MTLIRINGELYHFGTPGMSWYNRNYQNLDGTWTELGKERRRVDGGKSREERAIEKAEKQKAKYEKKQAKLNRKIELNNQKAETERLKMEAKYAKKNAKETKHFEKIKQELITRGSAEDVLKYAGHFDQSELTQALNRIRTEEALKQIANSNKPKERSATDTVTKAANFIGATGTAIAKTTETYNSFAKVYNSLVKDKSQKLPILDGKAASERLKATGRSDEELKKVLSKLEDTPLDKINAAALTDDLYKIGLLGRAETANSNSGKTSDLYNMKYYSSASGNKGLTTDDVLELIDERLRNGS